MSLIGSQNIKADKGGRFRSTNMRLIKWASDIFLKSQPESEDGSAYPMIARWFGMELIHSTQLLRYAAYARLEQIKMFC